MKTMNANMMSSWSSLLVLLLLVAAQRHLADAVAVRPCKLTVDLFRLPTHVQPSKYKLDLQLNPKLSTFSGKVKIDLDLQAELNSISFLESRSISGKLHPYANDRRKIILNAEGLVVTDVEFYQEGPERIAASICSDVANRILVVTLDRKPNPGAASLTFDFSGQVAREVKGLFRSFSESGKATLSTKLKLAYARRLFPCFDEPEFKAIFKLTIEHPHGTIALSNMLPITPLSDMKSQDGMVLTSFEPTPKMPSYLLGLAVGHFKPIKETAQDGTEIFIYAPINWPGQASEMLLEAVHAYDKVSEFFADLPRPLKKIDIVAADMRHAAMESWGLITVSCDILSAGAHTTKPNNWIDVVTVLMSQMIYQRLTNLVTISWWDDLWFKEGLNAHLASELTAELHREMGSKLYTLIDTTSLAMDYEDMPAKARIIKGKKLKRADQLEASFDSITYKKSQAVLRMFASFHGAVNFNSAVRELIESNSGGVLVDANEWLNKLLNKGDVRNVASQWTEQKGYPTIFVELSALKNSLFVSQLSDSTGGQVWSVPIQYKFHSDVHTQPGQLLLSDTPSVISLPEWFDFTHTNHWLKFNSNYQGYYRVVYHSQLIKEALGEAVKSLQMPVADRLQLLNDYYSYAKISGLLEDSKEQLEWFMKDGNDGVVFLLTKILAELHDNNWRLALQNNVTEMMTKYYRKSGKVWGEVSSEMALTQCARSEVIDYLVNRLKDNRVCTDLQRRIKQLAKRNESVPPFLRHVCIKQL